MRNRRFRPLRPSRAALLSAAFGVSAAACSGRDRPTFPTETEGEGPVTEFQVPAGDVTVPIGPQYAVSGISRDPDGVDSVVFQIFGAFESFPPYTPPAGEAARDSVTWGLLLDTQGHKPGDTITVRVYARDRLGNRGDAPDRQIFLR